MMIKRCKISYAFLLAGMLCHPAHAQKFVAPGGTGDGSTWAGAYGSIQSAIDSGDANVYLKFGAYSNTTEILISNRTVNLRGGYLGTDGDPYAKSADPTVITRAAASNIRIFHGTNSTILLDSVTVSNGYLAASGQGGGMRLGNCQTTITNCTITKNGNQNVIIFGGALYVNGGALTILNSTVSQNGQAGYVSGTGYGGAIYSLGSANVTLRDTVFSDNTLYNYNPSKGGCLYLNGGNQRIENCVFNGNQFIDTSADDGVVSLESPASLVVSNCTFTANTATDRAVSYGSSILVIRGTCPAGVVVRDCTFTQNNAGKAAWALWLVTSGGGITLQDCVIGPNSGQGIHKSGTTPLTLNNCLIAGHDGHGLRILNGAVSVLNSTVADNGSWGITNAIATAVTLTDSIIWGNSAGGVGGAVNASYVNSQNALSGTGNISTDPFFIAGYYLSVNGLPYQTQDSPCIGAGSALASALGLDTRTTRTDGTGDSATVDLGYHHAAGVQTSNLVLYVNPSAGDDTNDGWTSGAALKTLTNAMARAINGSTIRLAAGTYSATASGEGFPIVISQPNLRLEGTNRAATIINPGGTQRAFSALARETLWIEGLTVTNGLPGYESLLVAYPGGGALLLSCRTTITNCLFVMNRRTDATINGGAIYVNRGALTVRNCAFANNGLPTGSGSSSRGGAIALHNADSEIRDSAFTGNQLNTYDSSDGGAIYASGGSHVMADCQFSGNLIQAVTSGGGLISYASPTGLVISNSVFGANTLFPYTASGIIQLTGTGPAAAQIVNCVFTNNLRTGANALFNAIHAAASSGTLTIRDSIFKSNPDKAIYKAGNGAMNVVNCLLIAQASHGIHTTAGTVSILNSTLTENQHWGVTNAGATVTMKDTIIWNNTLGGVGGTVSATFCNSQNALAGTSNISVNPAFVPPFHHLSAAALQGGSDSPCINTGSDLASNLGLGSVPWTTRTDGGVDSGQVDMGYHYTNGTGSAVFFLTLYVDAVNGNDGNTGDDPGLPLKTITTALGKISSGGTIHVAAGTYNTALGETLPLVLSQNNLSLIGTNRALTLIYGGGVNRLLQADTKGSVWLEGLTFTNGYHASQGAGLHLVTCQTTITNCVLARNGRFDGGNIYGGAIYAFGGHLTVLNSELTGNGSPFFVDGSSAQGGAIWANGTAVTLDHCLFRTNAVSGRAYGGGGCLYLSGGSTTIRNSQFADNYSRSLHTGPGVLYLNAQTALSISNCIFYGNTMYGYNDGGGVVTMDGTASGVGMVGCTFTNNTIANAAGGIVQVNKAGGSLSIRDMIIGRNSGNGIWLAGASALGVTNSLIHSQTNHGVLVTAGTASLSSMTIANNSGWGVTNSAGTVTVKNSVVWGNTAGGITGATVGYTDSQEVNAGTGNLNTDPLFNNPGLFDFSLESSSPCVNKGDNEDWMETGLDLAGAKRRISAHVDMGAFESSGARGSILVFR